MEREGAPVDPIGGSANATRSEIALPDGAVIELERTEFTARQDTVEAKVQDGARYQGLLSREDYDKRKQRLGESLRAETDPEAYRREKLREAIEREDKARREADDARRRRERQSRRRTNPPGRRTTPAPSPSPRASRVLSESEISPCRPCVGRPCRWRVPPEARVARICAVPGRCARLRRIACCR